MISFQKRFSMIKAKRREGFAMEKLNTYLSGLYRFLVVGVFMYLHYELQETLTTSTVVMYLIFGLYALLFTLLRVTKWTAYLELVATLGIIYTYQEPSFYYLLLLPIINFASSNDKKVHTVIFSTVLGGFIYLQFEHVWFFVFSFIGIFSSLAIFQSKFSHIERLETNLIRERKTYQTVKKKLSDREMELENVLKMFVKVKELNEVTEKEKLIQVLVESSREFFNAHYACVYINEDGFMKKIGEIGRTERFQEHQSLTEKDMETDVIKSDMLQVVIYMQGVLWGAIRVFGKTASIGTNDQKVFVPFSELDHEILLTYVEQAMIKLKEVQLMQKNEFLANYDFLTGIPNRRYFIERFEQFQAMAARGESFSMMIIDIDHFKKFNDKYGHHTGDMVLKIVAETLQEAIRDKYDIVGRLGGEEFGVLLLNPNDQTFLVADRIRRMVSVVPAVEQITISVGIAYFGQDGTTYEELYNNADKALYHAKENGRNQVIEYHNIP